MATAGGIYSGIMFPVSTSNAPPFFSDLQKAMLDATPDCIKVLSLDGNLLSMNRAGCLALRVPEDSDFGMPWLPLLPEEVREAGLEALRKAADGQNARFPGRSQSPAGLLYWDNLLMPVVDGSGQVLSILCISRDVTAKTLLEKSLEDAVAREKLLSREIQHRIKNLFALVSGLIPIAEKEAVEGNMPEAATKILREKIRSLSRASDAVFSGNEAKGDRSGLADVAVLVNSVLQPYGDRCRTSGHSVAISSSEVTTLALYLHELATNSMKYGALSVDYGRVAVRWTVQDRQIELIWEEHDGPPISSAPNKQGFGSEMVDRIVQASGGEVSRSWQTGGLVAKLRLPNEA